MFLQVLRAKKVINCLLLSGLAGILASCNNTYANPYSSSTAITTETNIPLRAFVSNPVQPNGIGGGSPAIDILDASQDLVSTNTIALSSLSSTLTDAGMMVVSPKRDRTLVYSATDGRLGIVSNSGDSVIAALNIGGSTDSFFVANDNITAYVAVPNASVNGLPPGAVEQFNLSDGLLTATIPIPGARYVVPSPDSSQLLVFSENSDAVTLITPSLIGTNGQTDSQLACSAVKAVACVLAGAFDRPVGAVFSQGGAIAYVLNCGEQCGGSGIGACLTFTSCTSVSAIDMTQTPPAVTGSVSVPAATIASLQGTNLFVAGTPVAAADASCAGIMTAATTCGRLTVVNVGTMTASASVAITDGYHTRMELAAGGQLFIGASGCTNINSGGEVRGCLTIVNSTAGAISNSNIVVPADNGDVTGIAPIPGRQVVYVCEGGELRIYSTSTDQLLVFHQPAVAPAISGQAIDVKVVDF